MDHSLAQSPAQTIADAIVESATMVEAGRIASLARQGLEEPRSLTDVQARHVFAAFLLLFDPMVRLRAETAPPTLLSIAGLAFLGLDGPRAPISPAPRHHDRASTIP